MPHAADGARRIVGRYFHCMNANDWAAAAALFSDDFDFLWPQSNERIPTREAFVAINAEYPAHGRWSFTVRAVIGEGSRVVTDTLVSDGTVEAVAITFFEVRRDRIARIVEYWPEDYPPPAWRARYVEAAFG